jgi:hypothetical protein
MPLKLHRIVFLDLNNEHPCQWHRALLLTLVRSKQRRHDARLSESTNQADIAVMAIFLHSRERKAFCATRKSLYILLIRHASSSHFLFHV